MVFPFERVEIGFGSLRFGVASAAHIRKRREALPDICETVNFFERRVAESVVAGPTYLEDAIATGAAAGRRRTLRPEIPTTEMQ
jgi:hypothetical protein